MNNDVLSKVRTPAIGLLVTGCLNGGIALLTLLSGLLRLTGLTGNEVLPTDQSERIGFFVGTVVSYCIALISLLLAPVIIYGAVQMMNGRKMGLAKIASVLAIVPLTSCCCIAGIPIGIWCLITLSRPEVKELFQRQA